ncbi:MAG: PD40 domain-containing protein [Prolixibacteraceae bacterium]|nr:PD40 domain-containing protein [Burkholderiales bacterium]
MTKKAGRLWLAIAGMANWIQSGMHWTFVQSGQEITKENGMMTPATTGLLLVFATMTFTGCGGQKHADPPAARIAPEYLAFGNPERITIRGYAGDAMEPFITKDERYLLFNNRNDPRINTNLHFAERVDDLTFNYRGEIKGVNTKALDGVPSVDRSGNLFFVSTRTYKESLSTLFRGRLDDGNVSGVQLVAGISRHLPGILTFDAEIAADGDTLFVVDGRFTGGEVPETADIVIAVRDGSGFRRLATSGDVLKNVNTDALEYAPAIASDLLELFFTRLDRAGGSIRTGIFRASRTSNDAPFGIPEKVSPIAGFVEAPSLSNDGRSLYYHFLDGKRFVISRVSR